MKSYWSQNGISIYHADNRDILPNIEKKSVDLFLTDLPFAHQTHEGARTLKKRDTEVSPTDNVLVDFNSITQGELLSYFNMMGPLAKNWVVSFLDWRHLHILEETPPEDLRFVRFGIWDKLKTGAPQYTGDRPGTGWEAMAFLHALGGRMKWNGGGRDSVFRYNIPRGDQRIGDHPTSKSPQMIGELLDLFSEVGDLVCDPFAGGGVVAYMCRLKGRSCISIELEERYCENLAKLLERTVPLFVEDKSFSQERMEI